MLFAAKVSIYHCPSLTSDLCRDFRDLEDADFIDDVKIAWHSHLLHWHCTPLFISCFTFTP